MTTFKKGQRVWWNDPICEESGEYEVLDLSLIHISEPTRP